MPKFKTIKPSFSASKRRKSDKWRVKSEEKSLPTPHSSLGTHHSPKFSIFQFPFAVPAGLRFAVRLAACWSVLTNYWLLITLSLCLPCLARAGEPSGSIWREDVSTSMVADKRARAVGDIMTIIVQESAAATKENSTKTSKAAGVDASVNTFLYSPGASSFLTRNGQRPAMKYSSKSDFDGGGTINNSEKINARIAVRVADVLPNGNMIIEGRRETSFSGEKQEAILRGTIRSEDVNANNTVFSYNVADASIRYVSRGAISDAQRKGWFTKILDKVTPF